MAPAGDRSINFNTQVEAVDAASMACVAPARDIRERTPTGYIQDGHLDPDEKSVKFGNDVSFLQAASTEALPGQARRVSDRIPTGFISEDVTITPPADERSISFSTQVLSVDAASKACTGPSRDVRERTPTGYIQDGQFDTEEKSVKFGNDVSFLRAASTGALPGQARRVSERIPTGFISEDATTMAQSDERSISFSAQVEAVDAASKACAGPSRDVRERTPTGYIQDGQFDRDEKSVKFGNDVSFLRAASTEALPGQARRVSERIPTGFISEDVTITPPADERSISFSTQVVSVDAADLVKTDVPGSYASSAGMDDGDAGSRGVPGRATTGFVHRDEVLPGEVSTHLGQDAASEAVLDARTVSFRPAAEISLVEFDHGALSDEDVKVKRKLPLKSVRDRQQTSWVPSLPSDEKSVRFKDLPTSPLGKRTGSPDPPSASKSDSQTTDANTASTKSRGSEGSRGRGSEDDPPSDAETVSSASSRNPRSRMTTPFMSAVDWGYEVSAPKEATQAGAAGAVAAGGAGDSIPSSNRRRRSKPSSLEPYSSTTDRNLVKQVSIESSIEREITERVKLNAQRQAREERLVQVGSADANVPLALERCSSADGGNPEADLANHIVADAVKDTELLRNTLRNLAFFETFDDDALHCLIEAMEVYEFQHSEKVVRQGDTDGTHFFVVAHGEFCVLKDNNPHCYIGPGTSFGESVLLLFGERNATVCARGCARAYGMEGMQVRELLSKQYEQMRRSVVEATDEVLKSNLCEILSGLNGYELQSLYDQVEMRSFDEGDTILSEGDSPKEVLILYSGQVESWKDAQDVEAVPRFHLIGDYALPFKDEVLFEQPTNLRAATPVEVLVLKRSLLDNIFGDQLQQVLVKHRVLHVLAKHQDFSRLHQEHREAIAGSCQIRCLAEGSEQSWEDVRMIVALNGEIELRLETGPQHLLGSASDLFAIPYEQQKTSLQLKALGDSKLAVWQREDLGSILAFDDFDGALEQDNKVRSLRSVFIFATLSKQQLQRLANALQIQIVRSGKRVFSQGDQGTHFYIIRKGAVSVEIDGRMKRRLGDPDYFGERALLGSEIRSASITALEDTELWKMGKETFQEMMQGPCLDYLKDRISLQDTNLTFRDLEFVRVIGRGGFGVVKMVRAKKTGVRYALKCVRKRDVVEKNVQDALVSELSILKEVDHPFIIKFVRSFRNESRVYFLMELVSGGELLDALDALGLLKYSQALFYTGCIVLALEFLHSRRIAYLDLKSENCLIDQQGYLKMIDFGIARRITNTRYGPLKGTPMFMAPEMILGKGHTTVADLWSLGICLYEFVIGHFPFASNCSNHGQIFHQILRAELRFPEWFDKQPMADEIISLIRGLLTRDPKKRLGAGHEGYTKLKAHPFFKHLCWEKLLGREQEPPFAPTSETYAEDKERSAGLQAVGDTLPTVEEEEVRCAASEDPWEDPAPGWDADF